eukprot:scaffold42852_cov29-Tisochrysis_lutea.AAC.5
MRERFRDPKFSLRITKRVPIAPNTLIKDRYKLQVGSRARSETMPRFGSKGVGVRARSPSSRQKEVRRLPWALPSLSDLRRLARSRNHDSLEKWRSASSKTSVGEDEITTVVLEGARRSRSSSPTNGEMLALARRISVSPVSIVTFTSPAATKKQDSETDPRSSKRMPDDMKMLGRSNSASPLSCSSRRP